jgi:hypothetical protein
MVPRDPFNVETEENSAEFYLLGHNAVYHVETQPTFRRNMSPVTCSSETSVDFQRTTWRYSPENRTLHNHRCENLKFYMKRITIL